MKREILSPEQLRQDPKYAAYRRWLMAEAEQIFTILKDGGNKKARVHSAISTALDCIQELLVGLSPQMSLQDQAKMNRNFCLAATMINTSFRNPMYDTDALTLQFKEELRTLLGNSSAVRAPPGKSR